MEMQRIILVRHGESQANMDHSLHRKLPDHEIALSSRGMKQAKEAGQKLSEYYVKTYGLKYYNFQKITLWNSPYRRTRDTKDIIAVNLELQFESRENVLLCEQQFGLFDGLEDDEIETIFPEEFKVWKLCKKYNGKFWARYPMGESPFDAAVRIHQSFDQIKQIKGDHIIICHGTVVKLFVMMWFGYSPEWFSQAETIGNCGFYLLEGEDMNYLEDKGFLFSGYKKGKLVAA